MMNTPSDYNLDKPLVIGEFSSSCSGGNAIEDMYGYFYENKYDGAWVWQLYDDGEGHCSDGKENALSGIAAIKNRTDHGKIGINLGEDKNLFETVSFPLHSNRLDAFEFFLSP